MRYVACFCLFWYTWFGWIQGVKMHMSCLMCLKIIFKRLDLLIMVIPQYIVHVQWKPTTTLLFLPFSISLTIVLAVRDFKEGFNLTVSSGQCWFAFLLNFYIYIHTVKSVLYQICNRYTVIHNCCIKIYNSNHLYINSLWHCTICGILGILNKLGSI